METFRTIMASKTQWLHFFVLLIGVVSVTAFMYILAIPIVFWSIYGEGASSDRIYELPIVIFVFEWFALIAAMAFLLFGYINNSRKARFSNAKSYMIVAVLLIILYLLRVPILDVMFRIFQ